MNELIKNKLLMKDFTISYPMAILLNDEMNINYYWVSSPGNTNELLYISLPDYGNVKFTITKTINEKNGWSDVITEKEIPDKKLRNMLNGRFFKLVRSL